MADSKKENPKVLAVVNHYYGKGKNWSGKSTKQVKGVRKKIVEEAVRKLRAIPGIDIKICGLKGCSLINIDNDFLSLSDPALIIYESIEWMFSQIEKYDYFINMEDDILLPAETFNRIVEFDKKNAINECFHPNRMEYDEDGKEYCVDLKAVPGWTNISKNYAGYHLKVALNPHSGISILSREKLLYAQKYVNLKRRNKIIGHYMESAFANLHSPFLLFRESDNLAGHKVIHLDNWNRKLNLEAEAKRIYQSIFKNT
jgi:hypothetical protein